MGWDKGGRYYTRSRHVNGGAFSTQSCARGDADGFGFTGDRSEDKEIIRLHHRQNLTQSGFGNVADKIDSGLLETSHGAFCELDFHRWYDRN